MSGMKDKLSRRGVLSALATFALVLAIVVAVPGISGARAAVKQFKASMNPATASGNTASYWTETVTNCGTATNAPCTASSTIGLGTIQIAVPSEFRPITSVTTSSPSGQPTRNWTASYDSTSGKINAYATQGSDKLQPGEMINITFGATPSSCAVGTKTFTTSAWGSTPLPGSDQFTIQTAQPTIQITGCRLHPGESIIGPNGTTVTAGTDWTGSVDVSFDGTLNCSGDRWTSGAHLPDVVHISPDGGVTSDTVKSFTFTFDDGGAIDSSIYVICYAASDTATTGEILPPCYPGGGAPLNDPPCVDTQSRDFNTHLVNITIRVPAEDPRAH